MDTVYHLQFQILVNTDTVKKIIISPILIALAALLFSSCTKVIKVDLNSKDPQIVIEAMVTDDPMLPHKVKLTKSANFSESNSFPAVRNAVVTISDDAGNSVVLNETTAGVYENQTLAGVPGRTYNLKVVAEGKTYTSSCKMPAKVPLDSIRFTISTFGGGPGNETVSFTPVFRDPAGKGNFYRFEVLKGDSVSKTIFLIDDAIVDNSMNNRPLFDRTLTIKRGDSVTLKMMCISKEVNLYFYSLDQNSGGPNGSASPANPVTNIEGAVLGYFSANTIQPVTQKVQP